MVKTNWSEYQKAIFNYVENESGSLVVQAVAGSGKTTTIVECANIARKKGKSVLFLAFNKPIAQELSKKMDGTGVECKTLHAHGFRAIQKKMHFHCTVNNNKWNIYLSDNASTIFENQSFENKTELNEYIRGCVTLLNLARINLVTKSSKMIDLYNIVFHHDLDVDDNQIRIVNDILGICYQLDDVVDYTDMITLPTINKTLHRVVPKYDVIFVDEAQDLSNAQRELVLQSLKKDGRFIAVGDRMQAINGFAGADVECFNKLSKIAGHELPLSVCYRCGKDIIREAQKIVPSIQYFECSPDGEVIHCKDLKTLQYGDMILCRKSAPLVGLCLKLIANSISAVIKGKDLADGLKAIVKRTKAKTIKTMLKKIEKEKDKVKRRLEKVGFVGTLEEQPQYINICDKIECINTISDNCKKVQEVIEKLDSLFTDTKDGNVVTLSTIHKSKGLEADNCYIVLPDCLPMMYKGQQDWEYEQEMNLKYVAITRAKKKLYWVDLDKDSLCGVEIPTTD